MPETTVYAEDVVRLLVEELDDPGRECPLYGQYMHRIGETFQLSLPLRKMARDWVKANPPVTIGDLADGRY